MKPKPITWTILPPEIQEIDVGIIHVKRPIQEIDVEITYENRPVKEYDVNVVYERSTVSHVKHATAKRNRK